MLCILLWSTNAVSAQPPSVALSDTEELTLAVGENRTLSAADVKSYSEGAPGIAEVKVAPGGGQFVVVGQKPGTTTLLLIKRDGQELLWRINVFAQPVKIVESELRQLLGDTPGIRVRRVGSRFFIEGGVTGEAELQRIEHVARSIRGRSSRWWSWVVWPRIARSTCAWICSSCSTRSARTCRSASAGRARSAVGTSASQISRSICCLAQRPERRPRW